MICPRCKAEMPDEATYCLQCGRELSRAKREGAAVPGADASGTEIPGGNASGAGGSERPGHGPRTAGGGDVVIGGFRFSGDDPAAASGASVSSVSSTERARVGNDRAGNAAGAPPRGGAGEPGRDARLPAEIYATPLQRLGAFLLDSLILGAATFFATFALALLAPPLYAAPDREILMGNLVPLLLSWFYFAGMESSRLQATPGKIALGFKVADLRGRRIGFARASVRQFAKVLSALPLLLGYLMILMTKRRQGLHDMIAGCVALRRTEGERLSDPVRP